MELTCSGCGKTKGHEGFNKDRSKKTGYHTRCKVCSTQTALDYRKTGGYLIVRRKHGKTPNAVAYRKEYTKRASHLEKRRLYSTTEEYRRKRREGRNEKTRDYQREYGKTERYKAWRRKRRLERFKNEPKLRLDTNMGIAICEALCGRKAWRTWGSLTGYGLPDLMSHLELQFDQFMTWENYGSYWHVDHIIPRSFFKYETAEDPEFKKCWALSNLQPMEAIANIKKGNRIPLSPPLT